MTEGKSAQSMYNTSRNLRSVTKHPQIGEQVISGLRRAGGWLLGMAWLGLVFGGMNEVFGPPQAFGDGRHPSPILGYTLLVLAAVVMVVTAEHWKRVFPGIMLAAILNAWLELTQGHAVNNPSVRVSSWTATIHLTVATGLTLLTLTFKNRSLTMLDRGAFLAFVISFFWGAVDPRFASLKLLVGASCILAAWAVDRTKGGRATRSAIS